MTQAQTLTLADFLLARIAEDEAAATLVSEAPPNWRMTTWPHDGPRIRVPQKIAETFHPARVLAECEAKRRIVSLSDWTGPKDSLRDRLLGPAADEAFQTGIKVAMRFLALPYADHPDYRDGWRP